MKKQKYINNDPRVIRAKFDSKCAETGLEIKKGDSCIYYPSCKQVFHVNSKQAHEYREWKQDIDMGYNY